MKHAVAQLNYSILVCAVAGFLRFDLPSNLWYLVCAYQVYATFRCDLPAAGGNMGDNCLMLIKGCSKRSNSRHTRPMIPFVVASGSYFSIYEMSCTALQQQPHLLPVNLVFASSTQIMLFGILKVEMY